jgi:predicted Zn-dependent protease
VLLEYLQSLWAPLVDSARKLGNIDSEIDQRLCLGDLSGARPQRQRLRLPGGYVGVHLGLIALTTTSDQLASVLAHELTHVTQRHIARSIAPQQNAVADGAGGHAAGHAGRQPHQQPTRPMPPSWAARRAAIQSQLNFSRDMEREADRIGYGVLGAAGFSAGRHGGHVRQARPGHAPERQRRLPLPAQPPADGGPHRRGAAAACTVGAARQPAPPPLLHSLMQARARVLMDTRVLALKRWQTLDQEPRSPLPGSSVADALAAASSSALASTLLREWSRADASLATAAALLRTGLRTEGGRDPSADARAVQALAMLSAQSQLERGNAAAAAAALAGTAERGTPSRALMLLQSQIAMAAVPAGQPATGEAEGALRRQADALQTWVARHPQDAPVWHTLGQVWARLDQPLRSVRAEAEGRYAIGDLTGAVDRLRAGQTLGRQGGGRVDFIESSVIDARLREIEGERRREMMEREEQRRGG